jgi:hypothetical protein
VPSFGYDLSIEPEKYRLAIHMTFSPDVTLAQAVAALRNRALLHEFNPNADPIRILPISETSYGTIMSWRAFGIRTGQLAKCEEKQEDGSWSRRCDVRPEALDAGRYTTWKWDEVTCRKEKATLQLECAFDIQGRLKDFLFMKASVLTLKAKRQALINWGRFWYLLEAGGVSTRLSNPLFDRSPLKAEIEGLLAEGLPAAKADPAGFRLTKRGQFAWGGDGRGEAR